MCGDESLSLTGSANNPVGSTFPYWTYSYDTGTVISGAKYQYPYFVTALFSNNEAADCPITSYYQEIESPAGSGTFISKANSG